MTKQADAFLAYSLRRTLVHELGHAAVACEHTSSVTIRIVRNSEYAGDPCRAQPTLGHCDPKRMRGSEKVVAAALGVAGACAGLVFAGNYGSASEFLASWPKVKLNSSLRESMSDSDKRLFYRVAPAKRQKAIASAVTTIIARKAEIEALITVLAKQFRKKGVVGADVALWPTGKGFELRAM